MAYFGKVDQESDAPKFITNATTGESGIDEYGTRVFGIDAGEASTAGKGVAPGWVRITNGTGALETVEISAAGSGYTNADTITVVNTAGANATGTVTTDGSGAITAVTISDAGGAFKSKTPTVSIDTAAGVDAVLVATVGGRAGRTTYESIVAMSAMSANGSSFPS